MNKIKNVASESKLKLNNKIKNVKIKSLNENIYI